MAAPFPRVIVVASPSPALYVTPVLDDQQRLGNIRANEASVFSPPARIEVEVAETDARFVHLRFSHTNKYWALSASFTDTSLTATIEQPVEDISNRQCTMFEFLFSPSSTTQFSIRHVNTNSRVSINLSTRILVVGSAAPLFTLVDWDSLVRLPTHITFKGYNDRYMTGTLSSRTNYLRLSSDDPNVEEVGYEVQTMNDGSVRIKSLFFDSFWRRNTSSPEWIFVDSNVNSSNDPNTRFWPVKIDDNIIALRNAGNNRFVRADNNAWINSNIGSIPTQGRFLVEELVLRRDIYNVRYRMEDARIYDERPFLAGIATATNLTEKESSIGVTVVFEDSYTYSFTNSLSITTGVTSTIRAGIPFIKSAGLEISVEINNTFEWGHETTETKSVTAEFTVTVPARSRARVSYVGTQGKSSVPFNYTRRDKRSANGESITSTQVDGIYHGVNYYNFQFEGLEIEAL